MRLKYYTLDVFTDTPLGGNPLAVFPEGDDVPDDVMQRIAGELNLSETVFVTTAGLSPGAACRARIFTPRVELPFAGHPSVGTAYLLALIGKIPSRGPVDRIVLDEGVGPVPVMVRRGQDRRPVFAWLAAGAPEEGPAAPSPDALAALLSLPREDVVAGAQWSAGVPFLFVQVRDRAALGRMRLDAAAWEREVGGGWAPHVYVFAEDAEPPATVRARMFAPAMGIGEDPATGAAAAALAGLLAARQDAREGTLRWIVEQGIEMGRPSRLHVEADLRDGAVTEVRVGGACVLMSEGSFYLPGGEEDAHPAPYARTAAPSPPPMPGGGAPFAGLTPRGS